METLIKIENVWKMYQMGRTESLVVLKDVNLEVEKKEFVAITGPSGSGKSTLMHLMGALDRPSWGRVYIQKRDISRLSDNQIAYLRARSIGFIFQDFNLIPTLSALENVMLPMEIVDTPERTARERAKELLKIVGLGNRLGHKPTELSGGQQQMVAIARALANDPPIILADEPTGNLDSKTGLFIMDFLEKLNAESGKTIILVTHNLNLLDYANRVVQIKDGVIEKDTKKGKEVRKNE
ncbi:MAG: ABC transporter ATP-binding protein [Candidatus Woesearchaeota archaeon]